MASERLSVDEATELWRITSGWWRCKRATHVVHNSGKCCTGFEGCGADMMVTGTSSASIVLVGRQIGDRLRWIFLCDTSRQGPSMGAIDTLLMMRAAQYSMPRRVAPLTRSHGVGRVTRVDARTFPLRAAFRRDAILRLRLIIENIMEVIHDIRNLGLSHVVLFFMISCMKCG